MIFTTIVKTLSEYVVLVSAYSRTSLIQNPAIWTSTNPNAVGVKYIINITLTTNTLIDFVNSTVILF